MLNCQAVRLEVVLTEQCNYKCRYCFATGEPSAKNVIDANDMEEGIINYLDKGGIYVHFTGGEPTLRLKELLCGVMLCAYNGGFASLATNGWWAANEDKTREYLSKFCVAGLKTMLVSYDEYHAEYARWDNVKRILTIAPEYGVNARIAWAFDIYDDPLEVMSKLLGEDVDIGLKYAVPGARACIGRGEQFSDKARPFPVMVCPQSQGWQLRRDMPKCILLPDKKFVWRCEARNPAFTYSYKGDWTVEAEKIELSAVTQARLTDGLKPLEAMAGKQYHDGCSLCLNVAPAWVSSLEVTSK